MDKTFLFQILADVTLLLHVIVVLFVVIGLVLIIIGNLLHWSWVNSLWFRLTHLVIILLVVAEAWLGFTCPLTTLELWFRDMAEDDTYASGFIAYWLQQLLYWDFPSWVFTTLYTVFAILVVGIWILYPPGIQNKEQNSES